MRALIQRVSRASLTVGELHTGTMGRGLVVLLGVGHEDERADADWLAGKISELRLFPDASGLMNLSVLDMGGDVMMVSQFTLFAQTRKGRRPGFTGAARPEEAKPLWEYFYTTMEALLGKSIILGEFGADMKIELVNDGPVTIWIDTKNKE
ncbi:MAG: D-tyrosyl-tRNA(Tyr) deacylase [Saprospiraceae bacterium]|jgi:D-tyrosyl-tRNA(Tyr) deacylase|nr:D-tyrosyl-tRNA(Tyr) deacylase [Saprospiraceae bacterium]MBP9209111.1 D-tyrosyl-tRNA(Tyr) deacylase [Saprospiraceae bacterium]MBV6473658.1 D-aminoacyl-tRNA deacylase [Saprospiraceae bacterium]